MTSLIRNGFPHNSEPPRIFAAALHCRTGVWQDYERHHLLHLRVGRYVVGDQGVHRFRPGHSKSSALIPGLGGGSQGVACNLVQSSARRIQMNTL